MCWQSGISKSKEKKIVVIIFSVFLIKCNKHSVVLIRNVGHGKHGLAIFSGFKFPGAVSVEGLRDIEMKEDKGSIFG